MQFIKEAQALAKDSVEAIEFLVEKAGKRKWKWEPQQFGLFYDKRTGTIYSFLTEDKTSSKYCWGSSGWTPIKLPKDECIPLLHWEDDIEPILEGIHGEIHFQKLVHCFCRIIVRNSRFMQADGTYLEVIARGKNRQTSAMLAVIELRKKVEK